MGSSFDDDAAGAVGAVERGCLYVIATPIGNLEDLSPRARRILGHVDVICAEDTRVTARLLHHFGIQRPMVSLHDHNEDEVAASLVKDLQAGKSLALVSDAGTPLISDPGFALVRAARDAQLRVQAIPGASAALAALSISGLASDRFVFEGFLPPRRAGRLARLQELALESRTLIFFESAHRILECAEDLCTGFGPERRLLVARELTKRFEESAVMAGAELVGWLNADANRQRGEFALVVEGAREIPADDAEAERVLRVLLKELPPAAAARIASALTGQRRRALYSKAVNLTPIDPAS
jgi:16S rRNA (cytidine1402-2'-O)-methyltransferase